MDRYKFCKRGLLPTLQPPNSLFHLIILVHKAIISNIKKTPTPACNENLETATTRLITKMAFKQPLLISVFRPILFTQNSLMYSG